MSRLFLMPPKIVSGPGAVAQIYDHIRGKGKKALIVTDNSMVKFKTLDRLTDTLEQQGVAYEVYAEVNSEPTDSIVEKGVLCFKKSGCDFIIALGGGSPIDAAKAIGFMSVHPGKINSYMKSVITAEIPFLVAIPTTAGTGSEVTQFTIITDTVNNIKMLLKGPALMPQVAVVDPELTLTIPPHVTVATGIDAFTHAIEAYTSVKSQPLSDIFALSAIRRIYTNLKQVFLDGRDLKARQQLSLAALEAGIAFNNSSVTLVHGMSRPIGALFHIAHGVSNAVLLPRCLEFAILGNTERFSDIAKTMEVFQAGMTQLEASEALVCEVENFCRELEVPTLHKLQVDKAVFYDNLDKMANDALESGSPGNTFRSPSKAEIIGIYKKLW